MAFSAISQAGYIMLGVIGGSADGMTALVYYVLVYLAANMGVFAVISIIEQRSGKLERWTTITVCTKATPNWHSS